MEILLVEDNPADARLTAEVWRDAVVRNRLHVVPDGEEAITFLRREGKYATVARPDVNLPKTDGREVLSAIKQDPDLKAIPVVVLSSSEAEQDIREAYEHHANCYITKPVGLEPFEKACGCHRDPARRHGPHLYLKFRDANGHATSLYVPRAQAAAARRAVQAWSALWDTSVAVGALNRQALRTRVRRKPGAGD
jgi:CheY-like chemotaxis protein